MAQENGSHFKFIYSNWCGKEKTIPLPNGIHPDVVKEIIKKCEELDNGRPSDSLIINQMNPMTCRLSNLYHYIKTDYSASIINENFVFDQEYIYIYPVELNSVSKISQQFDITLKDKICSYNFIDTLSAGLLENIISGKIKLLISNIADPINHTHDLYEIINFFSKYGIQKENIIFIAGNKQQNTDLNIVETNLFLRQAAESIDIFPHVGALGYECDIVRKDDLNFQNLRPKKIICLNRSSLKSHRINLLYLIAKYDLLDSSILSFVSKPDAHTIQNSIEMINYVDSKNSLLVQHLENITPIELDIDQKISDSNYFSSNITKKEWYMNSYIHIISETRFYGDTIRQENNFFSEKTYKPIINLQPFIYVGGPFALHKLRELGFKTFSPFINESYDIETDNKIRFFRIEQEIKKISRTPIEEIHEWYHSIEDILLHNQNHLRSFKDYKILEEALCDINKIYKG